MSEFFISACCAGEPCFCGAPSVRKVEEAILFDDPNRGRHPFTAYVCAAHFAQIMRTPSAAASVGRPSPSPGGHEALIAEEQRVNLPLLKQLSTGAIKPTDVGSLQNMAFRAANELAAYRAQALARTPGSMEGATLPARTAEERINPGNFVSINPETGQYRNWRAEDAQTTPPASGEAGEGEENPVLLGYAEALLSRLQAAQRAGEPTVKRFASDADALDYALRRRSSTPPVVVVVVEALKRAVAADERELLQVANSNGRASDLAWARITASPEYKRLEANLAESRDALAALSSTLQPEPPWPPPPYGRTTPQPEPEGKR